jgi:hypothetical protein
MTHMNWDAYHRNERVRRRGADPAKDSYRPALEPANRSYDQPLTAAISQEQLKQD